MNSEDAVRAYEAVVIYLIGKHQELLELGGVYAQLHAVNYGVEVVDSVPEGRGDP